MTRARPSLRAWLIALIQHVAETLTWPHPTDDQMMEDFV